MNLDQLRSKADLLGVPWTYTMNDKKLKDAIASAEKRIREEKLMGGQEDKPEENKPACFGLFWAGIPGEDGDDCRECSVGDRCLDQFVEVALPKAEGFMGDKEDPIKVSETLKLGCPEAIIAARKYRANKLAVPTLPQSAVEDGPKEEKSIEDKDPPKKKIPPKKKAPKVEEHPLQAVSCVKSAEDTAKIPKEKKVSAQPATALVERAMDPWGRHTFMARWLRERERSPLIGKVRIGRILKVEWPKKSGMIHAAKCCKGYWKITPHERPPIEVATLYKGVAVVTGKPSTWSGPKFWKLR